MFCLVVGDEVMAEPAHAHGRQGERRFRRRRARLETPEIIITIKTEEIKVALFPDENAQVQRGTGRNVLEIFDTELRFRPALTVLSFLGSVSRVKEPALPTERVSGAERSNTKRQMYKDKLQGSACFRVPT